MPRLDARLIVALYAAGLTQRQIAKLGGVTAPAINRTISRETKGPDPRIRLQPIPGEKRRKAVYRRDTDAESRAHAWLHFLAERRRRNDADGALLDFARQVARDDNATMLTKDLARVALRDLQGRRQKGR
jgi:transcriptional regulator with XRE-family HTH domain